MVFVSGKTKGKGLCQDNTFNEVVRSADVFTFPYAALEEKQGKKNADPKRLGDNKSTSIPF